MPVIVVAQFCCTSMWFAGNGVITDLIECFNLEATDLGHLISAVQVGFIVGTLVFAVLAIADRFSPSRVFFASAIAGAVFNLGIIWPGHTLITLLPFRFATGFFLAGIYPVGMKIAADYFDKGLGKSLGFLVGALVLGTAFPHFAKQLTQSFAWEYVIVITTVLTVLGGMLIVVFVPDGPYRQQSQQVALTQFTRVFRNRAFRSAAIGYFGHMWELYAFWAFVPVMLEPFAVLDSDSPLDVSFWSCMIIGVGGFACVLGGYLAQVYGSRRIAFLSLLISACCCLLSPFVFWVAGPAGILAFLLLWGGAVVADSPLFSTLVAQHAPAQLKGSALTIVNCIGFSLTIVSIQLLNYMRGLFDPNHVYVLLALGPIIGLWFLARSSKLGAVVVD